MYWPNSGPQIYDKDVDFFLDPVLKYRVYNISRKRGKYGTNIFD